jgi:CheY-like chemotaxis protein
VVAAKKRILIIDDEAIHRTGLRTRLEAAGYEVYSAEGGLEAIELIQKMPFSLITLDLLMPQPDGFEVFRRLKALPMVDSIPILILTVVGLEPQVQALVDQGAQYLRKQDAPQKIVSEVRRLIGESPERD